MAENSKIEWTDHTFNPWVGCTKVSPACDHCYAEGWARRTGQSGLWAGERRRTSPSNWKQPYKWNNAAPLSGRRQRVFCASLADVFDNQVPQEWRADLFAMIRETPNLDWLLLTKRPQNIQKMLPTDWGEGYPNVWLGTTVENRAEADRRVPVLLKTPAAIRFLSCEPLLEHVHLGYLQWPNETVGPRNGWSAILGCRWADGRLVERVRPLDWVICGGESGPGARTLDPKWAESLRGQCEAGGVAFFMKQMSGVRKPLPPIPPHLMLRQFPGCGVTAQVDTHAERRDVKQARPARVGSAVREANAPKGVGHAQ
jgi:protein gp37